MPSRKLLLFRAAVLLAASLGAASLASADLAAPASYVDPFIGTGGHGHTFPGATAPFGMVQLSPDTGTEGWDWCSGYHYSDKSIMGFSHTHLSGTGCGDLGNILFVPQIAPAKWVAGSKENPSEGYRAPFDHKNEFAQAGYYRVKLDNGITAELGATERAGMHRYTFPAGSDATLLIDLSHKVQLGDNHQFDSEVKVESNKLVTGWQKTDGWANGKTYYFAAEFSEPITGQSFQVGGTAVPDDKKEAAGKNVKALLDFGKLKEPLNIHVGISAVSAKEALANLKAEVGTKNFDAVRAETGKHWNTILSRANVTTPDEAQKRTFYTALYHTMVAPTLYSDADGKYVGRDGKVHTAPGFKYYSTFSLWDTFRAAHPLYTLIAPDYVPGFISSILAHAEHNDSHELPVWPLCSFETGTMIGYHSVPVIVDAYFKGFRDFDAKKALEYMKISANRREGHEQYAKDGFAPSGFDGAQGTSRTLEYAYDDWCIAQFAGALGDKETQKEYGQRSQNYRKVYDESVGLMRGRGRDGKWIEPFKPTVVDFGSFTEANSWQYSWSVMQDVPGMIELMGGPQKFVDKLDTMWVTEGVESHAPDVSGLIGQYAHGNEPSHHVAYLYDFAGQPWKTQKWIRQICQTMYSDKPDGLSGNEDCGQMSAWYIFSALGFYPVNPASGIYMIGSPLFPKAEIAVGGNRKFVVETENAAPENAYIQSATLNGKPLDRTWITHKEISGGGTLKFVMGPKPNESWGVKELPPATGF
jgi:predicted alpha-1,2-mannosidase